MNVIIPMTRRNYQFEKMTTIAVNKKQRAAESSFGGSRLHNTSKTEEDDNFHNDTSFSSSFQRRRRRKRRNGNNPTALAPTNNRKRMSFMSHQTLFLILVALHISNNLQNNAVAFSLHFKMISRIQKTQNCCNFQHPTTSRTPSSSRLSSLSLPAKSPIHTNDKPVEDGNIILPFQMEVLYESDRVLAIHKPSGIPHHDDPEQNEKGILTLCRDYQKQQQKNDASLYQGRLYGVHRLDRVTSGILLFAKDAEMASYLSLKFRHVKSKTTSTKTGTATTGVTKYYFGISMKKPKKKKQGWVRGTMVRGRRKSWYLTTTSTLASSNKNNSKKPKQQKNVGKNQNNVESHSPESIGGEEKKNSMTTTKAVSTAGNGGFAETRFFTAGLGHLASYNKNNNSNNNKIGNQEDVSSSPKTCVLFRPYTGKTHQLRVAAKSIGLPLMGDPIYSDGSSSSTASCQVNMDGDNSDNYNNDYQRTYLHASAIHIHADHPEEESFTIWSPPPFDATLWPASINSSTKGRGGFQQTVIELLRKNCDCPEILQLAEKWYTAYDQQQQS